MGRDTYALSGNGTYAHVSSFVHRATYTYRICIRIGRFSTDRLVDSHDSIIVGKSTCRSISEG